MTGRTDPVPDSRRPTTAPRPTVGRRRRSSLAVLGLLLVAATALTGCAAIRSAGPLEVGTGFSRGAHADPGEPFYIAATTLLNPGPVPITILSLALIPDEAGDDIADVVLTAIQEPDPQGGQGTVAGTFDDSTALVPLGPDGYVLGPGNPYVSAAFVLDVHTEGLQRWAGVEVVYEAAGRRYETEHRFLTVLCVPQEPRCDMQAVFEDHRRSLG